MGKLLHWLATLLGSSEILLHLKMRASGSCCRFVGCTSMMCISRSSKSYRCSIGMRCGDDGGHWSTENSWSCSRTQMIWDLGHGELAVAVRWWATVVINTITLTTAPRSKEYTSPFFSMSIWTLTICHDNVHMLNSMQLSSCDWLDIGGIFAFVLPKNWISSLIGLYEDGFGSHLVFWW